jgi:hypothetical protein
VELKFSTRPFIPTLVISIVLFIMIFLPWATVSVMGFSASANGTHSWGILTLIMSLLGAGISFLADRKMRAMGSMAAGVLALLGTIIYMAANFKGGVGAGAGIIIALIASVALAAAGYMDYRKIAAPTPAAPANPPAAPPTPPPAQ